MADTNNGRSESVAQGWQPINENFPRHLSAWILWDEDYDRPAVSGQRSADGRFWAGDWDCEIKASLYLPYDPPPRPLPAPPKGGENNG